jgi:hypothetical protein
MMHRFMPRNQQWLVVAFVGCLLFWIVVIVMMGGR